jgi:hypothetical protein
MPSGRIMFYAASQINVDIPGQTLNPDYVKELDSMLQNATSFHKYCVIERVAFFPHELMTILLPSKKCFKERADPNSKILKWGRHAVLGVAPPSCSLISATTAGKETHTTTVEDEKEQAYCKAYLKRRIRKN